MAIGEASGGAGVWADPDIVGTLEKRSGDECRVRKAPRWRAVYRESAIGADRAGRARMYKAL